MAEERRAGTVAILLLLLGGVALAMSKKLREQVTSKLCSAGGTCTDVTGSMSGPVGGSGGSATGGGTTSGPETRGFPALDSMISGEKWSCPVGWHAEEDSNGMGWCVPDVNPSQFSVGVKYPKYPGDVYGVYASLPCCPGTQLILDGEPAPQRPCRPCGAR